MVDRISWSRASKFQGCSRAYDYKYNKGYVPNFQEDNEDLLLRGLIFHAGIATWLAHRVQGLFGALESATAETKERRKDHLFDTNEKYRDMVNKAEAQAFTMLKYYLPRLPIGPDKRYRVATLEELGLGDGVMIEYKLTYQFGDTEFIGYVDAVLYDTETETYVVVDWKTRSAMPFEALAIIDGQLMLYAAILNELSTKRISDVIMWQFLAQIPRRFDEYVLKNSKYSTRGSLNTTWEYIKETAPPYYDLSADISDIERRCKAPSGFENRVEQMVSAESAEQALKRVRQLIDLFKFQEVNDMWPQVQAVHKCRGCPFWRLCSGPVLHNDNVDHIVKEYYSG